MSLRPYWSKLLLTQVKCREPGLTKGLLFLAVCHCVGLDCRKDGGRIGSLGDSLWGITCFSYRGLSVREEGTCEKEGTYGPKGTF
jgi:hypothetical protein